MAHIFFEKLEKRRSTQSLYYGGFESSSGSMVPKVSYKTPQSTIRAYYGTSVPDQRCQPDYEIPAREMNYLYGISPPRFLYGVAPPEMRTYYGVSIPPASESSWTFPANGWSSWTYPAGSSSSWPYQGGSGSSWNYPASSESIWGISSFLSPLWNTFQTVINWQFSPKQSAPWAVSLYAVQLPGQSMLSQSFSLPTASYSMPSSTNYFPSWNVQ
ncbi:MAG: hypothetical protein AB1611_17045 [bacterium]